MKVKESNELSQKPFVEIEIVQIFQIILIVQESSSFLTTKIVHHVKMGLFATLDITDYHLFHFFNDVNSF